MSGISLTAHKICSNNLLCHEAGAHPQKPEGVVNEALQQIAYADRLVLNKTDLVTPSELDNLEARLRDINSLAQVSAEHANP